MVFDGARGDATRREEARRSAGEEGLVLVEGIGSTGFKGVYKNRGDPGFSALVNQGNAPPLFLGNFFTPEEAALAYARYTRDRRAGGLANRAGPSTLMRRADSAGASPDAPEGRRAESAGASPDAPEALPASLRQQTPQCPAAPPGSARHAEPELLCASFWQQKSQCPAAPPRSARHGEPSGFAPTAGTKVWAKQGPQDKSWWPAMVVSVLDAESFQVKWSEPPYKKWGDGARIRLVDLRSFSSDNPKHSSWLKGTHFGTDFGIPKCKPLRTKLNKAIGAIDTLLEATTNELGVAAEATVSPLEEVDWGGSPSNETGSVASDESADAAGSEARPSPPAARPSSSLQRLPAAYEEGAELGTMLGALGLLHIQGAFDGFIEVCGDSSSFDLQYVRRRCGEGKGFLSQLAERIGLGDAEVLAIQEYFAGSAATAPAPQSRLWDSEDAPMWR